MQLAVAAVIVDRGTHDGAQHVNVVGLGEVVVGAGADPLQDLLALGQGRLQDDRQHAQPLVVLHSRQQGKARHARHRAIEENDIEAQRIAQQFLPRLDSVRRRLHGVPVLQIGGEQLPIERVVIDHEDSWDGRQGGHDGE